MNTPDRGTYPTKTRISFSSPERKARVAAVDAALPVLIDPPGPSRVVVDTRQLGC